MGRSDNDTWADAFFAHAAAAGMRHPVILASGLDARGYRLPWPSGMRVLEIDQPQVLDFKTATLAALGVAPTAELRTVPIGSRRDWPGALRESGFNHRRPTAWTAAGLPGFLPPQAQDRLLDNITALSADASRLVAEVFLNISANHHALNGATHTWRESGLDIELDNLGFPSGSARTSLNQLLADDDAPLGRNYHCTAVLHKAA